MAVPETKTYPFHFFFFSIKKGDDEFMNSKQVMDMDMDMDINFKAIFLFFI